MLPDQRHQAEYLRRRLDAAAASPAAATPTAKQSSTTRRVAQQPAKRKASDLFRPDALGGSTTEGTKW